MRTQIILRVKRAGKFFGFNGFAAAWRMDEFTVADVQADMRVFIRAACVEENEVACLEAAVGDFTAGCRHIAGGSRQADAEGVFIDELNHAAAIKTGGSSAAAPFVRRTDKAHAVQHQLLRTLGVVDIADADGLDFSGSSVGFGRRTVFA